MSCLNWMNGDTFHYYPTIEILLPLLVHPRGCFLDSAVQLWGFSSLSLVTGPVKKTEDIWISLTLFVYIVFRNSKRSLLRDSVVPLEVDHRVKDPFCLIWLDTGASQTERHFLVLRVRVVDAGIVKVILLFYWITLCCRSWGIGQSWDVVIHRRWLMGSEDSRVH